VIEIPTSQGVILLDDQDGYLLADSRFYVRLSNLHRPRKYKTAVIWRRGEKMKHGVNLSRYLMRPPKGMVVDHINGDTLDNRRSNLRICTPTQNNQARRPRTGANPHEYKGLVRYKASKKHPGAPDNYYWRAAVGSGDQKVHVISTKSEHEGALWYNRAANYIYGQFAYRNAVACFSDNTQPRNENCAACNAECHCCCVCRHPMPPKIEAARIRAQQDTLPFEQ
jgi:hypothetical protein